VIVSKFLTGQKVKYFPVIGNKDFIETVVTSNEIIVCGEKCVFIEGVSGCVSVENLEILKAAQ
jgi:hypothetical protein